MAGRIPEETIQAIRERVDIVEVVSSYLPLKRSGANHLGLCPFHGEKTPSFNVNEPRQIFHCFGCGVGGNVFSFLMKMEGLSFPEAVRRLGERVGIEVAADELSPEQLRRREEREQLVRINEAAASFYQQILLDDPAGAPARRYLRERGYDGEIARSYRLGFAPERWEALAEHLAGKGYPVEAVRKLGLIRPGKRGPGDYDLFRGRLIFPISDPLGQVVAFGGRVLDDGLPKYINSPESPVYHKSEVLFGLHQAKEAIRQGKDVLVVEGYFDQLALARAGFPQAVATCGTALTADHARLLKRYAERVILLFDQDAAGQQAAVRALEVLLPAGLAVFQVALAAGEDPDSFLARHGAEAFRQRLAAARPALEVLIDTALAEAGSQVENRARAVEQVLAKLRLLPSDVQRQLYLKTLAERSGLDEAFLLRKAGAAPSSAPAPRPAPPRAAPVENRRGPAATQSGAGSKAQRWLLYLMVSDARMCQQVAEEGSDQLFLDPACRALAERILSLAAESGELAETVLEQGLDEEQKALLSGILIGGESAIGDDPDGVFADCRQTVARERLRQRRDELKQLIRAAEQAGDATRSAALLAEQLEINRQLKRT